ncbi:MAG: SDR family NAD(P)-dependent oxidoreductase [Endozoicomonas sp.]
MVLVTTGILHTEGNHGPGVQPEKSIRDFRADQFSRVFAVNTIGPAMIARYFLPKLVTDRKSVFAVLSARVGSISDNRLGGCYAYRASKAALNMIVKSLAIETARKQRQAAVVALHPGTVDSGLSEPFQSRVPSGQLFSPEYAAGQLLSVFNGLTSKDSGCFYAWDGAHIEF